MTNLLLKLKDLYLEENNLVYRTNDKSVLALCDISQTIVVSIFYLVNDSHINNKAQWAFSFIIIDHCFLIEFVRIIKPILKKICVNHYLMKNTQTICFV